MQYGYEFKKRRKFYSRWKLVQTIWKIRRFLYRSKGKNVVILEIGVGFNTPGIIRFQFEQMTTDSEKTTLIRIRM